MKKRVKQKIEKIAESKLINNNTEAPCISIEDAGLTEEDVEEIFQEVEEHNKYWDTNPDKRRYFYTFRSWIEDMIV